MDARDRSPIRNAAAPAAAPGIRLDDVRVDHPDGTMALDGVTLDVAPGEVVAVVGPSGSGKTTLLRAAAGLVTARGTVEIGGRDVTHLAPRDRNVAMVFETGSLISSLSVEDNIGFGLRVQRMPDGERHDRVAAEAGRLRLARLLSRRPATLSVGERGRAHIGHALVRRPDAWLFDEPLGHLDPVERFDLRHRLAREAKEQGVPTLYVTHDPAEALAVGDRVAVLRRGRIVQVATPRDLYARPVDAFVAAFVAPGPVGLLLARIVRSGRFAGLQVGDRTLPLWHRLPARVEDHIGTPVALVLRAEDVQDGATTDDPDVARLPGTVVSTEFTGPCVLAAVEVRAPAPDCPGLEPPPLPAGTTRLVVRLPREHPVRIGDRLTVAVDAARVYAFDERTGRELWHPSDLD